MIIEWLKLSFKHRKLYNSWLIEAVDIAQALRDVQDFVSSNVLSAADIANHPDFYFITRENASTKNISIEQIRKLQVFLGKTSVISGYKVAVIYQADLMNSNAANSCLKILEDTPQDSYIFLITSKAASILSTIRSRCFKINIRSQKDLNNESYQKFIVSIVSFNFNNKLTFINEFASKNRELWLDFIYNILYLMSRIIKKSVQFPVVLTELEDKIFNRLPINRPAYLLQKFINIKQLIYNTIDYDLDLRASYVLIMNEFLP